MSDPFDRKLLAALKIAQVALYTGIAFGGIAIWAWPAARYGWIAQHVDTAWVVLNLFGFLAAAGVALGRFRWEWVSMPMMAMGSFIYATLSWASVVSEGPAHTARALFVTGLAITFILRFLAIWLEVRKAERLVAAVTGEDHR